MSIKDNIFRKIKNANELIVITLICSYILGLFAHGVMMFNKMSFGDDVYCLFGYDLEGASYTSGRWASEIMEKIIEYLYLGEDYSIQLFNIIVFLGMSAVLSYFICRLLDIERVISVILISSMMVVFPTVTSTIGYVYTIVINEIAYLLVGISVYLIVKQTKRSLYVVAVLCSAFAIGIYQALIPFMMTLLILALMVEILQENLVGLKKILSVALKCLLYMIASFAIYAVAEKISLFVHGAELSTYQGICDSFSTGIIDYIKRVPRCYEEFLYPELRSPGDVYPLMSRAMYYASIVILIVVLYMEVKRLIQSDKKIEAATLVLLALLFPMVMNFVYLMVDYTWVKVHSIMKYTNVLIWIEVVALWEKGNKENRERLPKFLYYLPIFVMTITTVCYVRYSNLCYLTYELKFTQAISYCTELKTRMESTPGYYVDIPVVYLHENEKIEPISNSIYEFPEVTVVPYCLTIINDYAWKDFMYRWLGFAPQVYMADEEYEAYIQEMNLPRYPNDGSIKIIDGVMVVNF